MSKYTYKIRVRPIFPIEVFGGARAITSDRLAAAIDGFAVCSITGSQGDGSQLLDLQLQGDDHTAALNQLLDVVQNFGYSWIEATATEWTTSALRGALAVGGPSTIAGFKTGDPELALLLSVFGTFAGAIIGSYVEREKVFFNVHRTTDGWQFVEVKPQAQPQPATPQLGWA